VARGQVSAGWQRVAENASACFPLTPPIAQLNCGDYAASNKQGMGGSIEWIGRYALTPRWYLGGALSLRSSQNYNDTSALLSLRYNWNERQGLYRTDLPEGMFSELF